MNRTHTAKHLYQALSTATLAAILALSSGCFAVAVGAAAGAGAGTVAYIRGELDATLGSGVDRTVNATDSALAQLGFAKVSETRDELAAGIIARTSDDKKIEIKVTKEAEGLSKVSIRIGTFGDEAISRAILDKIKANL